ncbi:hypothetical protein BGX31_005657 [Mortierella sp. GBA43]|nr:hypothetical protein BGX31_005657 [Mortierella sp. GBA43]
MIKKREEWMKSKFKSPNLDKNPRYTAHVVKDVTSACPVDEDILEKLTPVVPKPRKPKTESEKEKEKARQGLKKKKKRQKKAPPAKPTGEGSRNIGEPKALKKLYDTTFKTVTLTFGCFTGTLRRATSMSKDEARVVADHLDKAVHTLSKTRILVFKALELFVLREVTSRKPSDIEQSDVVPSSSGSTTTNDLSPTNSPMDPLDLFLNKQHGQTLIRNLISLVLNGGIDRGRTSKDAHGIQARELAKRVYQDLKSAFPDVVPLNVKADDLCLAVAIGDMALNIFTSIRLHFGRLPELLEKKLLKISPGQDTATDTDDEVDDDDEAEETEDDQYKFDQGHVLMCWNKYMNLPKSVRPVFVPTAGFKDSFQQLSERALVPLLWGDKLGKVNPPTKTIMVSRVCSREEAERAEQSQYGELIRRLFVGDKEAIRKDPMKRQTSYGKKTTTMELLSRSCPAFSKPSLQEYVDDHFTFINAKKDSAHGSPGTSLSPPPLPTNADPKGPRYALSNQLFTNGLQVHVTAFDTRNSRKGPNQRASIPKLEERFPDRQAIVKDLGNSFREAVVVGVDPGERISAAFCRIDPQHPNQVSNLAIRRSALYSPTLSYRIRQEEAKRRDIIVDGSSESGTIELPSVHEFEQALPATTFNSIQEYEEGLRYYAQVFEILNGYYSTKKLKKQDWEKDKAMRAEKDLAVEGALQMVRGLRGRPALFVYGNGQFNTGIKLASMHETFKHYFMVKATGLKHIVVITDEYNTSAMLTVIPCGAIFVYFK